MNYHRTQLSKLSGGLTAKERGILVLRALKDKKEEDPTWRSAMPTDQVRQFNRYIALMNACNNELAFLITVVEQEVDKLGLRLGWLFCLRMWQMNLAEIDFAAALVARESITTSEYEQKVKASRDQYMAVRDLAVILVEDRRSWRDQDVEEVSWTRELIVTEEAWDKLVDGAEQELRAMAEAGSLDSQGKGKSLRIRRGSFDAWMGRPASVIPEYANVYYVEPDERKHHVEADRVTLGYLRDSIRQLNWLKAVEGTDVTVAGLAEQMTSAIEAGLKTRWTDLVAVERIVDEVAAEFEGEDPLKPSLRDALERAKASHRDLCEYMAKDGTEVALAEVGDDEIADVRRLVYRHVS